MSDPMEPGSAAQPRPHRHLHIELSPLERVRLWVEIVALLAAGAWAIYTFIYQTRIAPLLEPPHLITTTEVQRIGATADDYIERVQLNLTNDGQTSIDVAAFAINLYGTPGTPAPRYSQRRSHGVVVDATFSSVPDHGLQVLASTGSLLAAGGGSHGHIIMRPGDTVHLDIPAYVKKNRFAMLTTEVAIIFVRYPFAQPIPATLVQDKGGGLDVSTTANRDRQFTITLTNVFGL